MSIGPGSWLARGRRGLDGAFFHLLFLAGSSVVRALYPIEVVGRPVFDGRRPIILAPNHLSFMDPVVLQTAVPKRITFLMTEVYYNSPGARWFFRRLGCIPVPVNGSRLAAVRAGISALRTDRLVVVFPEGGISSDGKLKDGMPGIVTLARRARALVVPVGIRGTFRALPKGTWLPRPSRIRIAFGAPVDLEREEDADTRSSTRRIMESIRDLTG